MSSTSRIRIGLTLTITFISLSMACGKPERQTSPRSTEEGPIQAHRTYESESSFQLVDRTDVLEPEFIHYNGMFGELVMTEIMGPGAALFDVDSDGDLDLYLRQGRAIWDREGVSPMIPRPPGGLGDRLYRNDLVEGPNQGDASLRFTDITRNLGLEFEDYAMGVAAADFDRDGQIDLFLSNYGPDRMLYRSENGGFRDVTDEVGVGDARWSTAISVFDYDRDGAPDLFVGGYIDLHPGNHKICGDHDYCGPLSFPPQNDRLLRNRGDGSFEDVTSAAGLVTTGRTLGSVSLDFDRDGWPDLYIANDASENLLWRNRGDGSFEEMALLNGCALNGEGAMEGSMGVDAADVDGDGWEDLVMGHIDSESNTLFINQAGQYFLDRTISAGLSTSSMPWTGFGLRFSDFDLDGRLDLMVANGAVRKREGQALSGDPLPLREPNLLYRNQGEGRFSDLSRELPSRQIEDISRALVVGDLDNDGDPDVVLASNGGPARVLINELEPGAEWIGFRLTDADGEIDLVGANVWLHRAGRPPLLRRTRLDGGYLSSHDPRVRFGLGEDRDIERMVVDWPDGSRESWRDLATGRYHTLRMGSGELLP